MNIFVLAMIMIAAAAAGAGTLIRRKA